MARTSAALGVVSLLLVAARGAAQDGPSPSQVSVPEWLNRLTIKGKSYLRYSYELARSSKDFNEFDIDRVYLEFHWKLWDRGKIRYTLEGGDLRENGGDQFDVATKHFYLEVQDLLYKGTYLRAGQGDLPWVAYEEDQWGYRLQGTVFVDRSGYLTSTDLGVTIGGKISKGYGSWHLGVVNGEGWKRNEVGRHKDVHGRLSVNPFAASGGPWSHLFVAGFASSGSYDGITAGPDTRNRVIVQAGYAQANKLTLIGELVRAIDPTDRMYGRYPSLTARAGQESRGDGVSVFGRVDGGLFGTSPAATRWELLGRWDHLDPDDRIPDNDLDRWIGGVSYQWNSSLQSLLDYEVVTYQSGALWPNEKRIMLQTEVRF